MASRIGSDVSFQHEERFEGRPPAISLRNVSFSYGKEAFVEGLSADFERGRVTSIVGPNGCGKSTMVKLIDGLIAPRSGKVLLDGSDVALLTPKERARRVAVLGQVGRVPAMTVESVVACGRYPHVGARKRLGSRDRELVEHAMELAEVMGFRTCDMRRLSGGERQRVRIAMALAQDTDTIVLDEPTTYLDVHACHELMKLVTMLNREAGKTVVMVIHDIDLALRYSDNLLVMRPGGAVADAGTVGEVLARGCIEQAFSMSICTHESDRGLGYVLYPR